MKKPWSKLKKETPRAYEAFRLYLEHGSCTDVDELMYGPQRRSRGQAARRGRPNGSITEWSVKHRWVARRDAYLDSMAAKKDQVLEREIAKQAVNWAGKLEEIDRRQLQLIEKAQSRLGQMLDFPLARTTTKTTERAKNGQPIRQDVTIEPVRWSMASVASLIGAVREHSNDIAERRNAAALDDPASQTVDEQECDRLLDKLGVEDDDEDEDGEDE